MTPGTSGRALPEPSAFYDPETCCWRTSQLTFETGSTPFSLTLPRWGMTLGGALYELPTPVLPTVEHVSSSLPTPRATRGGSATETMYLLESDGGTRGPNLATPTAWLGRREAHSKGDPARWVNPARSNELSDQIAHILLPTPKTTDDNAASPADANRNSPGLRAISSLLPTPRATDGEKGGPNQRGSSGDLMLPSAVCHLLPTPTTQPSTGNGHARNLGKEAQLLPTPTAQAAKHSSDDRGQGTLDDFNLWTVAIRPETFSGVPTGPPSPAGSASLDDQLPGQLSLDATEND